jgi:hypothetical protein
MYASGSGKFLAETEKMQPVVTLVPAFKAIEIGVEPMRSDHQWEGYLGVVVESVVVCVLLRFFVCLKLKRDV